MDGVASFSNHGRCISLFAPGVDIQTDAPGNKTVMTSGTSFSAPYVSGVAALLLSQEGDLNMTMLLIGSATSNVLHGVTNGSPNLLLYANPDIDLRSSASSCSGAGFPQQLFVSLIVLVPLFLV